MKNHLNLNLRSGNGSQPIVFEVDQVWNGGWASRDTDAVQKHIDELSALGVPAPTAIPILFPLSANLATTTDQIQVIGPSSSGEVEYALLLDDELAYVTVASDHTDRAFETQGVQVSKQLYPNILASDVWNLHDCESHWDALVLRCWVNVHGKRSLYQEAALSELIAPTTWFDLFNREGVKREGLVFLSGTPPTIGGIVYAESYELQLEDPVLHRSISQAYEVEVLPRGRQ